jgi:hypothetical protein
LQALRDTLNASIARRGAHTDAEVGDAVKARLDEWEARKKAQ